METTLVIWAAGGAAVVVGLLLGGMSRTKKPALTWRQRAFVLALVATGPALWPIWGAALLGVVGFMTVSGGLFEALAVGTKAYRQHEEK